MAVPDPVTMLMLPLNLAQPNDFIDSADLFAFAANRLYGAE